MNTQVRYFVNPFADYLASSDDARTDWFDLIDSYLSLIAKKHPAKKELCDGGLYTGGAGVGYMYLHLAQSTPFAAKQSDYLSKAKQYVDVSYEYYRSKLRSGDAEESFLCGAAGVYALGACVYRLLNQETIAKDLETRYGQLVSKVLRSRSDEVFVGRAGWLAGIRLLRLYGGDTSNFTVDIQRVGDAVLESGVAYKKKHCPNAPLMYAYFDTEYIGAAHGLAGIVQQLLEAERSESYTGIRFNDKALQLLRGSVDFLLSLKQRNGNYPPALDDVNRRPTSEELVHFCHGAPGVVYVLAKAAVRFSSGSIRVDERYYAACVEAGELVWRYGLLRKGAGICHGIAGSAYVFLLLRRLAILSTGDPNCLDAAKYLYRAQKFAEFLLSDDFKQARQPDNPYSLFEGLAGTVCLLCDLMQPDRAQFPLFDVTL